MLSPLLAGPALAQSPSVMPPLCTPSTTSSE